ncbi:MAG: TIGR01777 family oxidoreductase [Chthoniobacterales bacterium]
MKVGITGVTGLIGSALAALCQQRGHQITGFSRKAHSKLPGCNDVRLFSLEKPVDVSGLNAIIHLAGEPVIGLWTSQKRRLIVASRRESTRHLVQSMASQGPKILLCASGTGFYGNRGAEKLDETAGPGSGFLAEVSEVWEAEAKSAEEHGIRSCQLRTGMVLAKSGGAFPLLRRIFSLGLGGKMGHGQQYLPWIHLADIAALYLHALENETLAGPINAVAPEECTNLAFTHALGSALHRPTVFAVPEFLIRAALGDLSSIVLESQRALPKKAIESGFSFSYPTLKSAFDDLV